MECSSCEILTYPEAHMGLKEFHISFPLPANHCGELLLLPYWTSLTCHDGGLLEGLFSNPNCV